MGNRALRVAPGYPPLSEDTSTANGTGERGVTGGETALAEANARAELAEARLSDFKSMLERHPRATGPLAAACDGQGAAMAICRRRNRSAR
jgi:hypothetical protein